MNLQNNLKVVSEQALTSPLTIRQRYPITPRQGAYIAQSRQVIADIIHGRDPRAMIICGPCSIHNTAQAEEYATLLKEIHDAYNDKLYIIMRVYFEKPRTIVGWKGLINDPDLDGSFQLEKGLIAARKLLLHLADLAIPVATEVLDPFSPHYLSDLYSWAAIGARTTESQTHRELASGLSMPVGFKNSTNGSIDVAINALQAASSEHRFMGLSNNGHVAIMHSEGNPNGHVILRGGNKTPNYHAEAVQESVDQLRTAGLNPRVLIDCSHDNSNKDYRRQPEVASQILRQIQDERSPIIGIMLESNLRPGQQKLISADALEHGVSITDGCIGWDTTTQILEQWYRAL